jgi:hypothetical protein
MWAMASARQVFNQSPAHERLGIAAFCMHTCTRQPWDIVISEHKRLQGCQPRQHGGQRAMVGPVCVLQPQARQTPELRPVIQLHAFEHPAFTVVNKVSEVRSESAAISAVVPEARSTSDVPRQCPEKTRYNRIFVASCCRSSKLWDT